MQKVVRDVGLISLITLAAYGNSLHDAFHFDDVLFLMDKKVTDIANVGQLFQFTANRPITMLTFSLNYWLSGEHAFSYRLFNLLLHTTNAFLVYWLVSLTLQKTCLRAEINKYPSASLFPLSAALIFSLHPVQTQSVNHIFERAVLLATFFFLLAVIFFIRAVYSNSRYLHLVYPGFFALALASKEIAMTLPVVLLLYDYLFIAQGNWRKMRGRCAIYVLLSLLSLLAAGRLFYVWGRVKPEGIGFTTRGITPYHYQLTELSVIVKYLQLLFFPYRLNVDYDFPMATSFWNLRTVFSLVTVVSLVLMAIRLRNREKLLSFGIAYFLITLAPESSFVPIIDVIFEHRLYLPSLGFCLAVPVLLGKLPALKQVRLLNHKVGLVYAVLFGLVCGIFLLKVSARNEVWKDEFTLWQDVVGQSPNKARPHNNLGLAFYNKGQIDSAITEYKKALSLDPLLPEAHYNLGRALYEKGLTGEAIAAYKKCLSIQPRYWHAIFQLGNAYRKNGEPEKAAEQYERAIRLEPAQVVCYNNLGNVYNDLGALDAAIKIYEHALALDPGYVDAHLNLSIALYKRGLIERAIEELKKIIRIDNRHFDAHYNLGVLYHGKGMLDEAVKEYRWAVWVKPNDPRGYNNAGAALIESGQLEEGIRELNAAIRLNPSYIEAHFNLAVALHKKGEYEKASQTLNFVLALDKSGKYNRQWFEKMVTQAK